MLFGLREDKIQQKGEVKGIPRMIVKGRSQETVVHQGYDTGLL